MLDPQSARSRSPSRAQCSRLAASVAALVAIALCVLGCASEGSGRGVIYDRAGSAHPTLTSSCDRWTRPGFGTVAVHGLPDGSFVALDSGIDGELVKLSERGKQVATVTSPWDDVIGSQDGVKLFATGLCQVAELDSGGLASTVRRPMPASIAERFVLSAPTDSGWIVLYPTSRSLVSYERGTLSVLAQRTVSELRSASAMCFDPNSDSALISERGGSVFSVNPTTGEVRRVVSESNSIAGDSMVTTPYGVWVGSLDDRGSVQVLEHEGESYTSRDVRVWGDGCTIVGSSGDGRYVVVARIPAGRTAPRARRVVDVVVFRRLDEQWLPFWEARIDVSGGVHAVSVGAHGTTVLIGTSGGVCHALSIESDA